MSFKIGDVVKPMNTREDLIYFEKYFGHKLGDTYTITNFSEQHGVDIVYIRGPGSSGGVYPERVMLCHQRKLKRKSLTKQT